MIAVKPQVPQPRPGQTAPWGQEVTASGSRITPGANRANLPDMPDHYRPLEPETRDAQWAYLCQIRREKVASALDFTGELLTALDLVGLTHATRYFSQPTLALDACAEKLADTVLPEVAGDDGRKLGQRLRALCQLVRALKGLAEVAAYESIHGDETAVLAICDALVVEIVAALGACRVQAADWVGEEAPDA